MEEVMKKPRLYILLAILILPGLHHGTGMAQSIVDARHVIVYYAKDRFAGWPANCASAIFQGDEIVAGFIEGRYEVSDGHNLAEPYTNRLARSEDGGQTWRTWDPENYVGDFGDRPVLKELSAPLDFSSGGFMMRIVGDAYHGANDPRAHFFCSLDRGESWQGPYGFSGFDPSAILGEYGLTELTPRTDYLVTGKRECILFISAREKGTFGTDRLFCLKTRDGGLSFRFQGWIIKPFENQDTLHVRKVDLYGKQEQNPYATECRAVMSSSVIAKDGTLLTAIRRKYIVKGGSDRHWIDLYASDDGGTSWNFRSVVCETGPENGNPPALEISESGTLHLAYGDREKGTLNVISSRDEGFTWGSPEILMDGFWSEDMEFNDLGYPRLFQRSDHKMVAVFYYSTKEHPHHLRACIWEPQ
jgi:hypothetical protein